MKQRVKENLHKNADALGDAYTYVAELIVGELLKKWSRRSDLNR
jgi:hypothetical protein